MSYDVDWIARARQGDDGSARHILDTLWMMGSTASDLWPEKARQRRILSLVVLMRQTCGNCGDVVPLGWTLDDHFNCNWPEEVSA